MAPIAFFNGQCSGDFDRLARCICHTCKLHVGKYKQSFNYHYVRYNHKLDRVKWIYQLCLNESSHDHADYGHSD